MSIRNFYFNLLGGISLIVLPAGAQTIGFEPEEGFSSDKDIAMTETWAKSDRGAAQISNEKAQTGTQSLKILPSSLDQAARKSFPVPADGIVFIDFSILPVADGSKTPVYTVDANGAKLGFIRQGDQGAVVSVSAGSAKESVANAVDTKFTFSLDDENHALDWIRVTIRQDLKAKKWDLYLDGKLALIDQPLGVDSFKGEARVSIFSTSVGSTFIDDIFDGGSNLLFPDADKDGIPDAEEQVNGTNAYYNDRKLDLNGDGISNIQNFQKGSLIGYPNRVKQRIIYVDNGHGSDAFAGEHSYRTSRDGPMATLRSAILAADADTVIALMSSSVPYILVEKAKGSENTINLLPIGEITISGNAQ